MKGSLGGLLAAQLLYLTIGAGLLPLLRVAPSRAALLARLPLAYMVGVAATGVLAAHLALLDAPLGLLELAVLAAVSLVLGLRRLRRAEPVADPSGEPASSRASMLVAVAAVGATLLLLAHAARAYAVRPLVEWDGWAIWGMKARALYEFGGTYEAVFTTYPPLQHPLFLPSLEAIAFRTMGAFDGTLVHVQLAALAFGFVAGVWGLLRDLVPAPLLGIGLLALVSAPPLLKQLSTNLADIPLAFLVSLGVVSLARSVLTGEGWPLGCAALFLGAAMLTKPEGMLFFVAALVAAVIALAPGQARRIPSVLIAAAVAVALLLPWRVFLAAHGLRNPEYSLGDLLDPGYLADRRDRVSPALDALWEQLTSGDWGLLVPLSLVGVAGALLARRFRLAAFAVLWPLLGFAGLVAVYWISVVPIELTLLWTAERTVTSLVIGSAALAPLLAAEAWRAGISSAEAFGRPGRKAFASLSR